MNSQAFFVQGNSFLLPPGSGDSQITCEFPLELAKEFEESDIFECPILEVPAAGREPGIVDAKPSVQTAGSGEKMITGVSVPPGQQLPAGWRSVALRQVLSMQQGMEEGNGVTGRMMRLCHIAQWRRDSRFCGSCGTKNNDAGVELARRCPACGRMEFPRISPAVITIIINDRNEILLAHNKNFTSGVYSLIAGFNEPGESLEITVAREIREEVDIEVRDIHYVKSQPWPFPNSLMIGFCARHASGAIRPDGVEIEDAGWFNKDNLPKLPGTGSLSRYLIDCWLDSSLTG